MNHAMSWSRPTRLSVAAALLVMMVSAARADIVTLGPNPQVLPNCPFNALGLPGACIVETAAQVRDVVADYSQVRIGRGGVGSLLIDSGASLIVNRTELAPGVPSNPDVIVGDDPGSAAGLIVRNGGQLHITVPSTASNFLGLGVGVFAAPVGYVGPSTVVNISEGGRVNVDKIGGVGIGSAVAVGSAVGSNSLVLLDGGINGFGNQAQRARLDTTGNLSIGREGSGSVNLFRYSDATANLVYLAAVGNQGVAQLNVGIGSTLSQSGYQMRESYHPMQRNDPHRRAHKWAGKFYGEHESPFRQKGRPRRCKNDDGNLRPQIQPPGQNHGWL